MFGKLKDKLKGWFKKSKQTIEETAEKQEIEEVIEEEKTAEEIEEAVKKPEKEEKEIKKPKRKKEEKEVEEKPEVEEVEKKDAAEILAEKTPEQVKEITEEKPEETHEDVEQRIEEVKEEAIEEAEKADKLIEETKKKKIPEAPLEYDIAKHKYEPSLDEIQEEAQVMVTEPELKPEKAEVEEAEEITAEEPEPQTKEEPEKKGFFAKLKSKFSYKITEQEFNNIFNDLEMLLLENNVALEVVEDIKKSLSENLIGKQIKQAELENEIKEELKKTLNEILIEPDDPLEIIKETKKSEKRPFIILFFGINGSGKTTSIAKLANLLQKNKLSVVLAAADTFRAASIEQISEHAKKLKAQLIKHDYGADPSAVGFDAIKYAKNHKIDVVLIDTAGRMHTKTNLLHEMEKICRVTNPDLKIFVAESIAGNDATEQSKTFNDMVEIDGSILSKVDIDEKGGTIISVSHATHKPIFYLGTGQQYKDLQLFNKQDFIDKLGL